MSEDEPALQIRPLKPEDLGALFPLRLRALQEEPTAFLSSPEDEIQRGPERYLERMESEDPAEILLGSFLGETLVGMLGIFPEARPKTRHRANVYGVYVAPEARGRGAGRAMLVKALQACFRVPHIERIGLSVEANNLPALRLYQDLGFEIWGREPGAMKFEGKSIDDLHLSLPRSVWEARTKS